MDSYDPQKKGRLISWGGDHTVFEYGDSQVLKLSIVDTVLGEGKSIYDHEVARRYFGDFVLETTLVRSPRGWLKGKIQRKLIGRPLERNDLRQESIRRQFISMLRAYRTLQKNMAVEIDLIGRHGVFTSELTNIWVSDGRLLIIDTSLIELPSFHWILQPCVRLFRYLAKLRLESVIRRYEDELRLQEKATENVYTV